MFTSAKSTWKSRKRILNDRSGAENLPSHDQKTLITAFIDHYGRTGTCKQSLWFNAIAFLSIRQSSIINSIDFSVLFCSARSHSTMRMVIRTAKVCHQPRWMEFFYGRVVMTRLFKGWFWCEKDEDGWGASGSDVKELKISIKLQVFSTFLASGFTCMHTPAPSKHSRKT